MKEIEDRAEHNRAEQVRFLLEADADNLQVTLYISTLDGSPVTSPVGAAWGALTCMAQDLHISIMRDNLLLPGTADRAPVVLPLGYLFAITTGPERRSLVVLDTPAQYSAAADMFNNPEVREMVGQPGLPIHALHPNHREEAPAMRRAAFKLIKGGAS